jgi:NitT/TauT family transport system permease protein
MRGKSGCCTTGANGERERNRFPRRDGHAMTAAVDEIAATVDDGGRTASLRNAAVLVVSLVALWQGLYMWVGESALASPLATVLYAAKLVRSDAFWPHLRDTMLAFAAGYALAVVLGLAIGFWLGFHRMSGEVMEPMVVAVYSLPKVTLYPILLLAFGLGISAKIAFGTLHGVIPIILFTLAAVRNVRPILIKTGRVLHLSWPQMVTSILFPAALPEIFTGLRIGFALTLIGTLLAEMFASQRGLGFLLMNGIGLHNVELIMAITLMIVVFAAFVSTVLLHLDHRLHRRS